MTWRDLLLGAAVQAALLAALGFLARSLMLHWLGKDLEAFKARLTSSADRAAEALKAELARDAREHQVRFASLHANQLAAIESLYIKLVDTRYSLEQFVSAWRADNREGFAAVGRQFHDLRQEVDRRRIHLPVHLGTELDDCIQAMWRPAVAAGVYPGVASPEAHEEFERAVNAVLQGGSVDAAIKRVEAEFRKALAG